MSRVHWLVLASLLTACGAERTEKAVEPRSFVGPDSAGAALVAAARSHDRKSLAQILGPVVQKLSNGDSATDERDMDAFVEKYDQMHRWVRTLDHSMVLHIGADNYPFPVPLERDAKGSWRFDSAEGEEELLSRQVGRNELLAIDAIQAIANAQELYRKETGSYAARIVSTPGKRDGLYWDSKDDSIGVSPLGQVKHFDPDVLTAPADSAPEFDGYRYYLVAEPKAFLVLGVPAAHRVTGVMSFLIGNGGQVYQRDLGAHAQVASVTADSSWVPVGSP